MTVSELHRPHVADPARPPLLPEHPRRMGPVTRLLVLRTVAIVLVVQATGIALVVSARWPEHRMAREGGIRRVGGLMVAAGALAGVAWGAVPIFLSRAQRTRPR